MTVSENFKMSQEDNVKCNHYNSGNCKFAKKEKGCKFFHPETICELHNVKTKSVLTYIQGLVNLVTLHVYFKSDVPTNTQQISHLT